MPSLLRYLRRPNCICICAYLWLACLAVGNAEEMLQNNADEIGTLTEENVRVARGITQDSMEMAALGRPLFPGTLYDCRRDSFLPGVTLWDKKSLSENLESRSKPQTSVRVRILDSLSDKLSLLNVGASLKTSFWGGLVEVGASVNYLQDTKSSKQQSRITMYYSQTTKYEQLTMSHLGKISYPEVFEQKTATHVVVAALYGAQAFMVFDRTVLKEENKQEIEGKLKAVVEKIPNVPIEGNVDFRMTDEEKKMSRELNCKFYGDVHLHQNPTTYMEAVKLYKQLPDLVRDSPQNEVPIKVWLYPLHRLNATAARVEREISTKVAFETESIIKELEEAETTYNDLSGHTLVHSFRDIKMRLDSFHSSFRIYKTMLLKAVGRVLPAIRGGEMEEKSLEDIIKTHRKSPFNADKINHWLDDAKQELLVLSSQTKSLEGVMIKDNLNEFHSDPNFDVVMCLTFTSLKYEDPYLSALKEFLNTDRFNSPDGEQNMVSVPPVKKWFSDSRNSKRLSINLDYFQIFMRASEGKKVFFVISAISDPSYPGSTIYVYQHGKVLQRDVLPIPV